jgi:hypothetical protein
MIRRQGNRAELRSAWAGEDARPHTGKTCPHTGKTCPHTGKSSPKRQTIFFKIAIWPAW